MRVRRGGRDRGTISIFVALSATSMMLFMGIVLDCGGRLRAIERADALAQEAARVGGQQVDEGELLAGHGYVINLDEAYAAADAYLQPYGLKAVPPEPGQPHPKFATSFTVNISTTYQTALLGFFDTPTLSVPGSGTATLVHGSEKSGGA